MTLTPHHLHIITAALYVAAEQYTKDAATSAAEPGHERIADTFKLQAAEARHLAEQIEQEG